MARYSPAKEESSKVDSYQKITDAIVASLERGSTPWIQPWSPSLGLPRNGHSDYTYNGLNVLLCWAAGFDDPRWYTFNQVKEYGASHVRKGEKGTHIVKWLFLNKTVANDTTGEEKTRRIPVLRTYVVFNFRQIEWDPEHCPVALVPAELDTDAACVATAALVQQYETRSGVKFSHGGIKAFYRPSTDSIEMPIPSAFTDPGAYWSTRLHEIIHSTGHSNRCARDLSGRFGSESYAAEELVAEMGSAFLCADMGLAGNLQHPEYLQSWIKVLKNDKYALFTAARLAREAVAFVKGDKAEEEEETETSEQVAA